MNLLLILLYNEVEDEYFSSAYNEKTNLLLKSKNEFSLDEG